MYRLLVITLCIYLISCEQRLLLRGSSFREPGEKQLIDARTVWYRYHCGDKKSPFLVIEQHEISPLTLYPDEEFNHHFVYAVCPIRNFRAIKGNLYRKIYFKGAVVFQDLSRNFEFKPGKWSVDAFIKISPRAEPGTYFLKLIFYSKAITVERNLYFTVQR
jgi:hypothetical protein